MHFLLCFEFLEESNRDVEDNDCREDSTFNVVANSKTQSHCKYQDLLVCQSTPGSL